MEFKNLTSKIKIPVLGLGTWGIGGGLRVDHSRNKQEIEAIQYAVSCGITHLDTAEIYGGGQTEELIGVAIKGFDRKKIFVTTKVVPQHLFFQKQIFTAAKNSLRRLKTDYIDLYLIHWPAPFAPIKNVMAAFDKLVSEGLVKFIGVSNFSLKQLQNAQKYSKNKIVTNQVEYSLLHREPENELLPFCQKEKIILTAYTPLASGRLAQKAVPASRQGFTGLDKIAAKYNKTCAQVALRWLIEKPQVIVIPKSSKKEHIDELLGSLGWKLAKEDIEYLDSEF